MGNILGRSRRNSAKSVSDEENVSAMSNKRKRDEVDDETEVVSKRYDPEYPPYITALSY